MAKLTPPLIKNDHVQGSPNALIELVEYGDFQCPYCGAAYPVVKKIQKTLGNTLKFVFRHFPLAKVHSMAYPAAVASEAAARQHRFWEMHDIIYERQDELSQYSLLAFAADLRLEMSEFKADLLDESLVDRIDKDFESGVRSGVNGTPSFYINGVKYNGSYDYISLLGAIELFISELQQK